MLLTTGGFCDLVRNALDIIRGQLVARRSQTQLALLPATAHEKSANIVDKSRVIATSANLLNISSIVLFEVDGVGRESILLRIVRAKLAEVVVAP